MVEQQIEALDPALFSFLPSQTSTFDRRALLALHAAVASGSGSFTYLEVGSYLGGSLQAVMRDPRCQRVISIDPRPTLTPDVRSGSYEYEDNSTERMLALLSDLPNVDMSKLTTLEAGTDTLRPSDVPERPTYCFIDGEHTDEAALRDARFCAEVLDGFGVIAFHDYYLVAGGIRAFLRERWPDISFALAFSGPIRSGDPGGVFAVELGTAHLLRSTFIDRAIDSSWHNLAWKAGSRVRSTPAALLGIWAALPVADRWIARVRGIGRSHGSGRF